MTHQQTLDVLVTDAGVRPGLVAVRDLGRAGVRVGAVDIGAQAPAFASRWCTEAIQAPDFHRDPDAYVDDLIEACVQYGARAVIPAHDGTVEALRGRRSELESRVGLALAPEPALAVAIDKTRTLEHARRLGLRVPRGETVADPADATAALDAVGLPAVIKPARSWAQGGDHDGHRLTAIVATERHEALGAIGAILADGIEALVQEWLPGDREALSFMHAHGRTWARFAQRAERTAPPLGGNSVLRVSIPMPPDVSEPAERLVADIGLDGYTEVEFRRDAQGRAALMEINPRLSAAIEVAIRSGVHFPRLLYRWLAGEPLEEVRSYRTGVRMRWLGGDLEWLKSAFTHGGRPDVPGRGRALATFLGDFARPSGYDYVDSADPRPALRAAAGQARPARELVRRRVRRLRDRADGLDTDVAIVGAGPYGLAIAAHLRALNVRTESFGRPMDLWSEHMPHGMFLKSEGFASHISSPDGRHTLWDYCVEQDIHYADIGVPIALDTFTGYGRWFAQRLVPDLHEQYVSAIARDRRGFRLQLDDGSSLRARRVVVATGLQGCRRIPAQLRHLGPEHLVHAYDVTDVANGWPTDVAVIGHGSSALETSTLLAEHGVRAHMVARAARLAWPTQPSGSFRKLTTRVRDPLSGLGESWRLRTWAEHPLAFHSLPEQMRVRLGYGELGPAGAWWLRRRFERGVNAMLERHIIAATIIDGGVQLTLDGPHGPEELRVGRVVASTGYEPDLSSLEFLDDALRADVALAGGAPALDRGFQSSVPGLHFAGYSAAASFGPVMRFVFGTEFAARRIARELAPGRAAAAATSRAISKSRKRTVTATQMIRGGPAGLRSIIRGD